MNARRFHRTKYGLFLLLAILLLLVVGVPAAQAGVWTDAYYYNFGDIVQINGDGMQPGENVTVYVYEPGGMLAAEPWLLYADEAGAFATSFLLTADMPAGEYALTVLGEESGATFSCVFDPNNVALSVVTSPPVYVGDTVAFNLAAQKNGSRTWAATLPTVAWGDGNTYTLTSGQYTTLQGGGTLNLSHQYTAAVKSTATATVYLDSGPMTGTAPVEVGSNGGPLSDAYSASEDTQLSVAASGVLANDSVSGSNPYVSLRSSPGHGTLTLNANGGFTYLPTANWNGTDSFTYNAYKSNGTLQGFATVTITVSAVNDAPVAKPVTAVTDEDTAKQVTLDATDVDGDLLTYEIAVGPTHGSLGTVTGNKVTYTPTGDYNGPDSFTYKAKDAALYSNTATVSITVNAVNDAPTIGVLSTSVSVDEGSSATNTGTWGDVDGDNVIVSSNLGAVTMQPLKSWSWGYTPPDGPTAASVFLSADDQHGGVTGTWFVLTVNNVAPTVDAGTDATIDEGDTFAQGGSFSDPGADTWTATVSYGDSSGERALTLTGNTFALSHAYADNGSYTVTVSVFDGDVTSTDTAQVTVNNVAPTVSATGAAAVIEGSAYTLGVSVTDPGADTFAGTVAWGDGNIDDISGAHNTLFHTYAQDGVYTITMAATDDDGGVGSVTKTVMVNNVAPTLAATGDADVNEGSAWSGFGTVTDPGVNDVLSGTVDYGDGISAALEIQPDGTFTLSHVYDNGPNDYNVVVTAEDGDGGEAIPVTITVTVNNVVPVVDAGVATATIAEGDTFTRAGSFSDPGNDEWSAEVNWGEAGAVSEPLTLTGKTFNLSHLYDQDGVYPVTVRVYDGTAWSSDTTTVTVTATNVLPTVDVGVATATIDEGDTFARAGSFSDPGADTWTAEVKWSATGSFEPLTLTDKSFHLEHIYDQQGSYDVTVRVHDDDGFTDANITVTVNNVVPTVNTISNKTVDEGSDLSVPVGFTDPGPDAPWSATVSFSSGAPSKTYSGLTSRSFTLTKTWADSGGDTVTVTVQDKDGGTSDPVSFGVTVRNVAPTLSPLVLTGASGTASVGGNVVDVSFSFTDPGANDNPWAIDINWGDGKPHTTYNAATQGAQSPSTHTYAAGTYTITVKVTDKDGGTDSRTGSVSHLYNWTGFFSPVDMGGVFNVAKAGSAIPVKFSLAGNFGLDIFASGYPRYARILESGNASEDAIEETVTAGNSSLSYSGNQYVYVWKTEKSLAGTCQQLQVKLMDGTVHAANFKFK
jgi:hypothetical protein